MARTIRNTHRVIPLLQSLVTCLIFTLSPQVIAGWKFHDYTLKTPDSTNHAHMSNAAITISFRDSALTFSVEENDNTGKTKWHGMFTSAQAIKALNSIETANINPFDNSQTIVLNTTNPRSGIMGDGRMAIAFGINYTDLRALSQAKGKLLVINYNSHGGTNAAHFDLNNYTRALKQLEKHIKRAEMQQILTD